MQSYQWIWSEHHQDHYYVTYDQYGQPIYHWSKQLQPQPQSQSQLQLQPQSQLQLQPQPYIPVPVQNQGQWDSRNRHDSGGALDHDRDALRPPEPASTRARAREGFIPGTPNRGWVDELDDSYRMRTGTEAQTFFVAGRVFAMLYVENASGTSQYGINEDAYTVVRFGEWAHSTIRRFVVLERRRGYVKACAIGTYSGRGTLKPGCVPSEYAIVYCSGNNHLACYLPGEYEAGMTKEPIEIVPEGSHIYMRSESRIRFSKTYPIEMNVKVKNIGMVHPAHMSKLAAYWDDEENP